MIRSLYTSAVGMTAQMNRMDVVSNNIANVNTTGFKRDVSVTSAFDDALAKRIRDNEDRIFLPMVRNIGNIRHGAFVEEVHTDFSQGNHITTHGTYDLAISGSGFFVVSDGNGGELFTRDGSFTVDVDGYLVTKTGHRVQGTEGDITLTDGGIVTIEPNGDIYVDGELTTSLLLADFEDLTTLRKQGDNFLAATQASVRADFEGEVLQGSLEGSNVNSVKEMVDLITVNRIYEANQRIIQAIDQSLQRSAQDVGRKV